MKKFIFPLFIATVTLSSAFADMRGPMGPFPGPGPGRRDDDQTLQCLKDLNNANRRADTLQIQLNSCLEDARRNQGPGRFDPREMDRLRGENQRLSDLNLSLQGQVNRLADDNNRLLRDNGDLRRQLDDLQGANRSLGFFSYAGCKDFAGNILVQYISSAVGRNQLEAETLALQSVPKTYSCTYGIGVAKTEEIRTTQANNYCVAGCKDFAGNIMQQYISSGNGRNVTEAQFNALKAVSANFSCTYGIGIKACQ